MNNLSETFKVSEALHDALIPSGTYPVTVLDSTVKLADDGIQEIIVLSLEMTMPTAEQRSTVDYLRINSDNPIVRQIARNNFADMLVALNIGELKAVTELRGKSLQVRVTVREIPGKRPLNNYSYFASKTPVTEQRVPESA